MQEYSPLPEPSADALRHSEKLAALIGLEIETAGGWIPFSRFMEMALYAPGLGYYSAGARKFGPAGDFVTAPELSPVFAACIARVAAEFLEARTSADIVELGAGTGALAAGLLRELGSRHCAPAHYYILEVSADLRERQRDCLAAKVPDQLHRVAWLDGLPAAADALVIANEVADALPVDRFVLDGGETRALGVVRNGAGFAWAQADASPALKATVSEISETAGREWPAGYIGEVSRSLPGWVGSLGDCFERGLILVFDYGLPRRELYHAGRSRGTLSCHYRHRAHDDPFLWPGLQDITAWVDFSALAEASAAAGLAVARYTTQAQFLLASGIAEAAGAATDTRERVELAGQLRRLLLPGEMGEAFKLMALEKNLAVLPASLGGRDLAHLL